MANFTRITWYIGSGKLNAMYTLRMSRESYGDGVAISVDNYICNLAVDRAAAEAKAEDYVARLRDRYVETETYKVEFCTEADFKLFERRSTLSVRDTHNMFLIEQGVFPFGKHAGARIDSAPDSYILFFADKAKDPALEPVMLAIAGACMGVALDRDLIAKRQVIRDERAAQDALSNFIGEVGKRQDFTGEVLVSFEKQTDEGSYWINKLRCGQDLVSYFGCKSLGTVGSTVTIRGTVKSHDLYNGVKTTKISRPA